MLRPQFQIINNRHKSWTGYKKRLKMKTLQKNTLWTNFLLIYFKTTSLSYIQLVDLMESLQGLGVDLKQIAALRILFPGNVARIPFERFR